MNKDYKILNKDIITTTKILEKKSSKVTQNKNCQEKSDSFEESEEPISENNHENERILASEMNFEGCVFQKESQMKQCDHIEEENQEEIP